ncbi:hypothetical protein B7486_13210 [cyanobacterium TDX16]|nr:hypothetical protein B7486_13210 [cyanobacterium TDX16]
MPPLSNMTGTELNRHIILSNPIGEMQPFQVTQLSYHERVKCGFRRAKGVTVIWRAEGPVRYSKPDIGHEDC